MMKIHDIQRHPNKGNMTQKFFLKSHLGLNLTKSHFHDDDDTKKENKNNRVPSL